MRINEIFYSLQGEGFHTGTAAVFVRFTGCNLQCPFCDTKHNDGRTMSEAEIVGEVMQYPAKHVVITGGEPALQLTENLVDALHSVGRRVAVETNGTRPLPANVDWITLSPKDLFLGAAARVVLRRVDEIKVVFDGQHRPPEYSEIEVSHARFLQPCDTGDPQKNSAIAAQTVDYIKGHPQWRLSLQTHKMLQIP